MTEKTVAAAQNAQNDGNLWRAKEILRGRVGSHGFDPYVYEELGKVLLKMGDTLEAGKYLFLSGSRTPSYNEAINLYSERFVNKGLTQFRSSVPAGVKGMRWNELPDTVREELQSKGYSEWEVKRAIEGPRPWGNTWKDWVIQYVALGVLFLILAFSLVGIASTYIYVLG